MASRRSVFASVFLHLSVIRSLRDGGQRTQLATISKRLPTVLAFVWLVASVTALVPVQGCLSSKGLAADRATEVFI